MYGLIKQFIVSSFVFLFVEPALFLDGAVIRT
jgi:hypothetical protein